MVAGDRKGRVGLVVHPTRDIDAELARLREWTRASDRELVQVSGQERQVTERAEADTCDVLVTLGGDGTMLTGVRIAGPARRPVLGVACGSLGVLTAIPADALPHALDRFFSGEWVPRGMPALEASGDNGSSYTALNDVSVIRAGEGQVTTEASVDGVRFARFVGDGLVVSTPLGSSAYTLAGGGPLLAPGADAFVLTPLASHGGSVPPLVVGPSSTLGLELDVGHGGARLEIDGDSEGSPPRSVTLGLRRDMATLVTFDDAEPLLAGLRRRRIVMDSPRVVARDQREGD